MKYLLTLVLTMAVGISFALFVQHDAGYMVFGRQSWSVETSLSVFALALLFLMGLCYEIGRFTYALFNLPKRLGSHRQYKREQRAQQQLQKGVELLLAQQWQGAEKAVLKKIQHSPLPLLHYLTAAYSAEQQGNSVEFSRYIALAKQHSTQHNDDFVTVLQAQQAAQQGNMLAALTQIEHSKTPLPSLLALRFSLYHYVADVAMLLSLLPEMRQHRLLTKSQCQRLELRFHAQQLENIIHHQPEQLVAYWRKLSKSQRLKPQMFTPYFEYLCETKQQYAALTALQEMLKYHWHTEYVTQYGLLEVEQVSEQRQFIEKFLKKHPDDCALLLTIARLYLRENQGGEAKHFAEKAHERVDSVASYQLLGDIHLHLQQPQKAASYFKQGLQLSLDKAEI